MLVCMCVLVCVHARAHVVLENNFQELGLSCHFVGSRDGTEVVGPYRGIFLIGVPSSQMVLAS